MKHHPRKRFGQNFLTDPNTIRKIVELIQPRPDERILEIGPGQGAVTAALLAAGSQLSVVEIDRDLAGEIEIRFQTQLESGQLRLYVQDALKSDLGELMAQQPFRLVGNLPYNISTPLLFHAFRWKMLIQNMVFMLQKEVVNRMAAEPGSSDYGRLSVMTQYHCQVQPAMIVPPQVFYPPPKVDSRIVILTPHREPGARARDESRLAELVRIAFSHRRKTLRNALRGQLAAGQIEACDLDPGSRPETVSLEGFVKLANLQSGATDAI